MAIDITTLTQLYQGVLDTIPLIIVVYEQISQDEYRVVLAEQSALSVSGVYDMVGRTPDQIVAADEARNIVAQLRQSCATGQVIMVEEPYSVPNGMIWGRTRYVPITVPATPQKFVIVMIEDITAQRAYEHEREQQEAVIAQQQASLAELSTPLLAISDEIVVMPIVGTVDSRRVQQIMDALLSGVAEMHAGTVILDITGVPIVDTQVANALLRASQAVKLLGAQVVLTGIRPEVAQTLVGLGVDLSGIITLSSLQSGIAFALKRQA